MACAGFRPQALADLPAFRGDRLEAGRSGGDIGVQACADDPQVAFHAVRTLARIGRGVAGARWSQSGFDSAPDGRTGRNLMGFKDGTNNLDASDAAAMRRNVWVGNRDEPAWMRGGTYLVIRRIRIRIERWDASDLDEQETDVGRRKVSGAPFGARSEFAPVVPELEPRRSHIMLANPRTAGSEAERILRRGYSFDDGLLPDGKLDAGLFFAAFQRDPRRQFVPIQRRLAEHDLLGEYLDSHRQRDLRRSARLPRRRVRRRHAALDGHLANHIAGREPADAEARWDELLPAYRDMAADAG